MRFRPLVATAMAFLLLPVMSPGTAKADACGDGGSLPDTPETTEFYESNFLLGPAKLPKEGPVGAVVSGYERFGDLKADAFKQDYIVDGKKWNWPPSDGFALKDGGPYGQVDRAKITLKPGTQLDRFGFAAGKFLAPKATPFPERALPPQALETPSHTRPDYEGKMWTENTIVPPSNYHAYCVQNAFDVDAGAIAPWFGQPGRGMQYMLMPGYVPDQPSDKLSVQWLLSHGPASGGKYLVEQLP